MHLRNIFIEIWTAVHDPNLINSSHEKNLAIVEEYINLKLENNEIYIPNFLLPIIKNKLKIWI